MDRRHFSEYGFQGRLWEDGFKARNTMPAALVASREEQMIILSWTSQLLLRPPARFTGFYTQEEAFFVAGLTSLVLFLFYL